MPAASMILAVKSHGYHWNVTGPLFPQLHAFFGTQYEALFEAADALAERLRALGEIAPSGVAQLLALSGVDEAAVKPPSAAEMINDLVKSHALVRFDLDRALTAAAHHDDKVTEDLLIQRAADHDKTLWMLQSMQR